MVLISIVNAWGERNIIQLRYADYLDRYGQCMGAFVSCGCHSTVPWMGWVKQQTFTVSRPGGWKLKIKVSVGLVPPDASLLGV